MDDLISKKMAIIQLSHNKTGDDDCDVVIQQDIETIKSLPSTQPEIIHCKDCKHFVRDDIEEQMPYGFYNTYFHAFCDKHWDKEQGEYIDVCLDDHCSFAERRTDEQTD